MEMCCICAADTFAVISGYVGINKKSGYGSFIILLFIGWFYSIFFSISFGIINSNLLSIKTLLYALFPATSKLWWYYSAYFVVGLLSPFVNKMLLALTEKAHFLLCSLLISCCSVLGLLNDSFCVNNGYSSWWLLVCYIIGAYLYRHQTIRNNSEKITCFIIYLTSVLVTIGGGIVLKKNGFDNYLAQYISPTVLLCAVALVRLFSKFELHNNVKTLMTFIAPHVFPVYLIHEFPAVRSMFISEKFAWIGKMRWYCLPLGALAVVVSIFTICVVIDCARASLFKVLKVDLLVRKIAKGKWLDIENNETKKE